MAIQSLHTFEIRLEISEELCQQYSAVMQDYFDAGHMKCIYLEYTMTSHFYYTPNREVLRLREQITKYG